MDPKSDELVAHLIEKAKQVRSSFKYSERRMVLVALLILKDGGDATFPIKFSSEAEKERKMQFLSHLAKVKDAAAVVLISETRWLEVANFNAHFNIPDAVLSGEWHDRYRQILGEYNGAMKNLPRNLWGEAVMVSINGPGLQQTAKSVKYTEGPNDTVIFGGEYTIEINLVPDWWTVQ